MLSSFITRYPLDNQQIYQVLHVFLDLAIVLTTLGMFHLKKTNKYCRNLLFSVFIFAQTEKHLKVGCEQFHFKCNT